MPRTPMVTRTLASTKVVIGCVNMDTKSIEKIELTLPRTYKDDEHILKTAQPIVSPHLKCSFVESKEVVNTLYGMEEYDFITSPKVKILPLREKKQATEE